MYKQKKTCGIYKIENLVNGKSYIGQSVDIFRRWKDHSNFWEAKKNWSAIKHALHKHCLENFTFTILEECLKEDLNDREIYWIKKLNTQSPHGYNMTAGGGGSLNASKQTRAKMSKAKKGKKLTKEHVEKVIDAVSKSCVINDVEYKSTTEASKILNFKQNSLSRYLAGTRKWPEGYTGYYK